jgi:hypothetical protein
MNNMTRLPYTVFDLFEGCLFASITHAIMTARYPALSYEQSWDGFNYSIMNGSGIRGTISFTEAYCIAAFRDEHSPRMKAPNLASRLLCDAPAIVQQTARAETLQYLLMDTRNGIEPVATAAFWGKNELYSPDSQAEMMKSGGDLIKRQLAPRDDAVRLWQEYYSMSTEQIALAHSLYRRKECRLAKEVSLSEYDIVTLGDMSDEGCIESKQKFKELTILWPA